MPRDWPQTHMTANKKVVGFKLRPSRDGKTLFVFFNDSTGRRREISTGCSGKEKASTRAREIIEREYAPPPADAPELIPWEEARTRLRQRAEASGLRNESTVPYYLRILGYIQKFFPNSIGPQSITQEMAQRWADAYVVTPKRNGEKRSGHTAVSVIVAASALWETWFCEKLEICHVNPFADVEPPKVDQVTVQVPTKETLTAFEKWLGERFGDWALPRVFFLLKEALGCRVTEVCKLRSHQVRDGRVHFDAKQTKGRKARSIPLSPALAAELEAVKGPWFLWESYPASLKKALDAKGWPSHRLKQEFNPKKMVAWIMTLFADFNAGRKGHPKLTSHSFRKKAFTEAWEANIDPKKASIAFGCNVDTMMKHYIKMDEQAVTDEVFTRMRSAPLTNTAVAKGESPS